MSRRRNRAAGLAREIANRQRRQQPTLTLVLSPQARTPQQLRDALAPRPEWCEWQGWGYLMPERDGIDTPTGYYPLVETVRDRSFAEYRGQVAA